MEKLDDWPSSIRDTAKYNWSELCDGHVWVAEQGEDFTCSRESFRNVLTAYAKRHNLEVEIHAKGKVVRFKFYKPGDA